MYSKSDDDPDDPVRARTPENTKRRRGESSKKTEHKKQKFRHDWLKDPKFSNWLSAVHNNEFMAKCKLCMSDMCAELSVLKKHVLSKKHLSCVRSTGTRQQSIGNFVNDQSKLKEIEQTRRAEILLCGFISEHNLSFNLMNHLTAVCKQAFPDSKIANSMNLSRTKATSIVVNVIGKNYNEDLVDILKSTCFSIIIDESTDVGCLKTLCICVKYFEESNNKFQTKFFKLIQLFKDADSANEGATAQNIFDEVMKAFIDTGVPLDNIIGN